MRSNEKDIIELLTLLGVEIGEDGRIRFLTEEENEEEFKDGLEGNIEKE